MIYSHNKIASRIFLGLSFESLMGQLYIQYLTSALDKKTNVGHTKNVKNRPNSPNLTVPEEQNNNNPLGL